jgi:hypothetical protein
MSKKPYCGSKKPNNNQRLGTINECAKRIALYGLNEVTIDMLRKLELSAMKQKLSKMKKDLLKKKEEYEEEEKINKKGKLKEKYIKEVNKFNRKVLEYKYFKIAFNNDQIPDKKAISKAITNELKNKKKSKKESMKISKAKDKELNDELRREKPKEANKKKIDKFKEKQKEFERVADRRVEREINDFREAQKNDKNFRKIDKDTKNLKIMSDNFNTLLKNINNYNEDEIIKAIYDMNDAYNNLKTEINKYLKNPNNNKRLKDTAKYYLSSITEFGLHPFVSNFIYAVSKGKSEFKALQDLKKAQYNDQKKMNDYKVRQEKAKELYDILYDKLKNIDSKKANVFKDEIDIEHSGVGVQRIKNVYNALTKNISFKNRH